MSLYSSLPTQYISSKLISKGCFPEEELILKEISFRKVLVHIGHAISKILSMLDLEIF